MSPIGVTLIVFTAPIWWAVVSTAESNCLMSRLYGIVTFIPLTLGVEAKRAGSSSSDCMSKLIY